MTTETLIVAGVIVLLVVLTFIGLLSRYRKCASDEILVVFGKAGKKKVVNENTAGNFMAKTAENLNPAFDLLRSIPFADTLKSVLGKKELEEKKAETTEFEEVK